MSRYLTGYVDDLQDEGSPNALLAFLTLRHENLSDPIRVVSDPTDFIVDGQTFIGLPFGFELLTDEDAPPTTKLVVQNVDRRIGEAIRPAVGRIEVALEVRSLADFDLTQSPRVPLAPVPPIYAFQHFGLVDVTVTALTVEGTVMLRDYTQSPWPGKSATQSRCPGLFR